MKYIPSTFNPNYDITSMFPQVDETTEADVLANPGKKVFNLDFLDQKLQNVLNNILFWNETVWSGQKWTTLCYKYQGTTSTWFINLTFNGLASPMQLQPGMVLRFPLISEINRALAKANTNKSTNVISIGPPNVLG